MLRVCACVCLLLRRPSWCTVFHLGTRVYQLRGRIVYFGWGRSALGAVVYNVYDFRLHSLISVSSVVVLVAPFATCFLPLFIGFSLLTGGGDFFTFRSPLLSEIYLIIITFSLIVRVWIFQLERNFS